MKKLMYVLLVIIFFQASGHAQEFSADHQAYVDSVMNANYNSAEPGAVILIAKNGQPVFRKAYGMANLELEVPNKPEYVFCIGSMSKQFTAVSILQLAQEGKLSLDEDIRKYLPWYNTHGRKITMANLLSHTSGIPSFSEKPDFIQKGIIDHSKREMADYFMNDSLLFEPGTDWSYSNSGYTVANLVLEEVSGMSFSDYVQNHIFEPLGMKKTYIGTHERLIPQAVSGYSPTGDGNFRKANYFSWTWLFGGGLIISCVDDLLKWDEALYTEELLRQEWLKNAWRSFALPGNKMTNYGFGWILGKFQGTEIVTHGGATYGFRSNDVRIPSAHVYVIILSNKEVPGKVPEFTVDIALMVAGKPLIKPRFISTQAPELKEYIGVYKIHRLGSRIATNMSTEAMYRYLTINNETLFSQLSGDVKKPLLKVDNDLFVFKNSRTFVHFNRDQHNKVISLEINNEPVNVGPNAIDLKTELELPKEKTSIKLSASLLQKYKGKYDFGSGFYVDVTIDAGRIYIKPTGQKSEEIFAESENNFFPKSVVDASIEFVVENDGNVSSMILNWGGTYEGKKIE